LGKRPESIPAALASECACRIKTNRINERLSQVLMLCLARIKEKINGMAHLRTSILNLE
jgi:hypothetical protein